MDLLAMVFEVPESWKTFLSDPWVPAIGTVIYLITIFTLQAVIGTTKPSSSGDRRDQSKPNSHPIRTALLWLHNAFLCAISLIMLVGSIYEASNEIFQKNGSLYDLWCDPTKRHLQGRLYNWVWIFHISKYYEFIDTIFIVVSKKPLEFLHVYHHVLTLWITWFGLMHDMTFQWMGVVTNTFIHTLMYYYYTQTAVGKTVWWKKYLTMMQMVQFCINTFVLWLWVFVHYFYGCSGTYFSWLLTCFANVTFWLLFFKFYSKTYTARTSSSSTTTTTTSTSDKSKRS
eukprot:TRINITY_DN3873_c0_g1_i2.p2 TRINITY_DN3873_c0_g1~~TRINITY_DN3873_c0_g1_i2.p2  ORF type:complete len:299 (-),score=72.12 TRINITY_DN3873_c0_g1_i2:1834-2688(-)